MGQAGDIVDIGDLFDKTFCQTWSSGRRGNVQFFHFFWLCDAVWLGVFMVIHHMVLWQVLYKFVFSLAGAIPQGEVEFQTLPAGQSTLSVALFGAVDARKL